jgi:hypothetical protein
MELVGGDSASIVLSAYGKNSLGLTGALAFPQLSGPYVQNLVRWGSKGFAFVGQDATFTNQIVYLLTSSLANSVASNPIPHLLSVTPNSVPQGTSGSQLTLNGQGFTEASVVKWNGVALQTNYMGKTVLTATVISSIEVRSPLFWFRITYVRISCSGSERAWMPPVSKSS